MDLKAIAYEEDYGKIRDCFWECISLYYDNADLSYKGRAYWVWLVSPKTLEDIKFDLDSQCNEL